MAQLPPVRGWHKRLPRRGIRCLLNRHVTDEIIFQIENIHWGIHIEECRRCKRPIEVKAKNRKQKWR